MAIRRRRPVATLWQLAWNKDQLSCAIYRARQGLELRIETGGKTLLTEPFELGPRMISRSEALKRSLKRRGWR